MARGRSDRLHGVAGFGGRLGGLLELLSEACCANIKVSEIAYEQRAVEMSEPRLVAIH